MDEQKMRMLVQEEIRRASGASQFGVQNIPFHTHNGVDSPIVYSSTNIYTGFVPDDADITGGSTSGFIFFPQGWTANVDTSGSPIFYTIVHNLNTSFYTVSCSLYGAESADALTPTIICLPNAFTVAWFDYLVNTYQTDFSFQLVQVNNSAQTVPQYTTRGG